jgi:hypothetical protein
VGLTLTLVVPGARQRMHANTIKGQNPSRFPALTCPGFPDQS